MARQSYLTTFEISRMCEVNPTTVQNWVKENKLKAYVTPGGHRRIRREDLLSFLEFFGMPVPAALVGRRALILIVDDEPSVCDLLREVMERSKQPIEAVALPGAVEALLFIGERKPDLMILDIMLPGMNGIEVCKKLKSGKGTRDIKIVAISGNHDPAIREEVLRTGADLFFTKPLDVVRLRDRCMKLIGK